jgi:uncharacterized membrane protein YeaQ/YmgE (transglycosylase-associated protein family)
MSLESLLVLTLFSTLCGIVGQMIGGRERGSVGAIVVIGFIGALFGTWMAAFVGLPLLVKFNIGYFTFSVIWSILGSALLMSVASLYNRRHYYEY